MSSVIVVEQDTDVVEVETSSDVVEVITGGQPGPPGPQGEQGPQGEPGISAGRIFYYAPSDPSDIPGYKTMLSAPSPGAEQTIVTACTGTGDTLVAAFATDPGTPGAVDYPAGTAFRRVWAMVSGGAARLHLQVYVRTADGVETLVRDELSPTFANQTVQLQEWLAASASGGAMSVADRIVNKIWAQRVTGPGTVTVTTFYEGTTHGSHIQTTISTGPATTPVIVLTQAEYDALTPPDDGTLYVIID